MVYLSPGADALRSGERGPADAAATALSNSPGQCRSCRMVRLKLVAGRGLVKRRAARLSATRRDAAYSLGGILVGTRNVWWQPLHTLVNSAKPARLRS